MTRFSTCRFCGSSEYDADKMVKYGVRHYAHHVCYLKAGKLLSDLHPWQIEQFPYRLLQNFKLMDVAYALVGRTPPGEDT
jgi:hypothetical protein